MLNVMRFAGHVRYMNRWQDTIVYCEDDFIVTCDERHGLHSVWKAKEVCADDVSILHSTKTHLQNQVGSS